MLIEAFGTCFRRRGEESGVESFEESSFWLYYLGLGVLLSSVL